MKRASFKGRLLVASPTLADPNFERTVILILEDQLDEGALGVVLNRPSEREVAEPLPGWAPAAADPPVIFIGGPVRPSDALCVGRLGGTDEAEGWKPLVGPLGTMNLHTDPEEAVPRLDEIRVFAGYAGWLPGQLEQEIFEGGWFVVNAEPSDALSPVPEDLWATVLRRQPGSLALYADFPPDPSSN